MSFQAFAKKALTSVADNSPTILTGLGVAGVVSTAYLASKASFRAADILAQDALYGHPEPDWQYKAKLIWPEYIPAAVTLVSTVVCVVCANRIHVNRYAALSAAYSLSEKAYDEYRDKTRAMFGEQEEQKIRRALAEDRVRETTQGIYITDTTKSLFFDLYSKRYFESTMEEVRRAENEINHTLIHETYAPLRDLYNKLGMVSPEFADEIGWNSDNLLEINPKAVLTEEDKPCIAIEFSHIPVRNYWRHS